MKIKNKKMFKIATISMIAAFSFGLSLSSISSVNRSIKPVSAENGTASWSYNSNNKTLTCTDVSTYPSAFIEQTNQTSVLGLGNGQYEITYNVLGYSSGAMQADMDDLGTYTLVFIMGSYEKLSDDSSPYGIITASPNEVNGLDSNQEYEIYVNVAPTGDMSEQGSESIYYNNGAFYSVDGGDSDPLVLSSINFYGDISYENGSADLVFVNGNSDNMGTLKMSHIEFSPKPEGDGSYYSGNISGTLESTSQQVENYYSNGARFWEEEVFNPNTAEWSWDSGARAYSCDYTPASTGITITYKALFLPPSGATGTDQIICEYTPESGVANVTTTIYNHNDGDPIETGMTKNFEFLLASEPSLVGDYYEFQFGTTVVNTFTIAATYVSIVEQQIPEPPALSALQWYFDTDMGYFVTNLYNDNYYSFSLSTEIISVIYDRGNSALTARCLVTARDGNMPEEYYDAEMTFDYTFTEGGLVENTWRFYGAVCATTIEETEDIYFSPDIVSFRQLGWYYDEDLRYYVEEGVTASWNILHAEYRTEGSRNEFILYMQILYDNEYTNDVIQINHPNFDEAPYRGQTTLGTGVSGWSDKLQQSISLDVNYVPFGYYADGWSYDPYSNELVYINADDIDMKYQLASASSNEGSYLLTYTCDGDSQSITVTGANYVDQMLTGEVELVADSDPITVNVLVPQSIIDGGTTSTGTWNYDSTNHTLVYYDESHGGSYNMTTAKYDAKTGKVTLTYRPTTGTSGSPVTIEIEDVGSDGYDDSTNMVTGYAYLNGSQSPTRVSFYLEDLQGNSVTLESVNSWVYSPSDRTVLWVNSEGSVLSIEDLEIYICAYHEDNSADLKYKDYEYLEVTYVYNDEELSSLRLTNASYNEDGDYYISGIFNNNEENVVEDLVIPHDYFRTVDLTVYPFRIIFDGNGSTSGSMSDDEFISIDYSTKYVFPECSFQRSGYTFVGWGATSDAVIKFQPGSSRSLSYNEEGTRYYALWKADGGSVSTKYTISFDANGGNGIMDSLVVDAGRNKVPECAFTRPGYVFAYWAVGSATSDLTVSPGSYVSVDSNYVLFAIWAPGVQPEEKIEQDTINAINNQMDDKGLSSAQQSQINQVISDNKDYISDDAGQIVAEALYNTDISTDPVIAEAQKELVVTVIETGLTVDATKASSISGAQQIDKALPDDAHFSVEGEIDEFYQRQMYELFGGEAPSRIKTRAYANNYEINTDTKGKSGTEAVQYLGGEAEAYQKMVGFVDNSVGHMGKAALKLRKCSGESVVVQVKSYVSVVKVSSFREFDKAAADKKFVEEVYKAIMLSMQNEVIAILEKEHEPSKNAEKEAKYQQELDAVKDFETFEIMVTEVLRQKYNTLVDEPIEDVDEFRPIYWEIFTAWALDQPSPYKITLEELTQATIEESTSRARAFTVHSDLSTREWVFIGSVVGGAALVISAAAIIPRIVYKKKEKEGIR